MAATNFKVVIVGGGPVGLTAAHALLRAGIDFVLLESRQSIVIEAGSNLVLSPMGLRILANLGLLDAFARVSTVVGTTHRRSHDGRDLGDFYVAKRIEENHGVALRAVSRHDLTKVLYDALPDSVKTANLHANKRVRTITTSPTSATVHCDDGTSYEGTIVIGADGAHSVVRSQMRALALADINSNSNSNNTKTTTTTTTTATTTKTKTATTINPDRPFLTNYRCLWARFPTKQAGLSPGAWNETHGTGCAIQLFAGEGTSVIAIYERLEKPTRERIRFGPDDEAAFVARWGDLPLAKDLTVREAYAMKLQAGLVGLEEGVVRTWSWGGCVVLVGDAAHKFTPSTGAGCNNGMVDVVVLVNELYAVLGGGGGGLGQDRRGGKEEEEERDEREEAIAKAFEAYQTKRRGAVEKFCAASGKATDASTWKNGLVKFLDVHVLPYRRVQRFFLDRGAPEIANTPVLEFVEDGETLPAGRVPWVESSAGARAEPKSRKVAGVGA